MKTKIFLPTLLLLTILLTSCYKKQTFVSDINSDKKTCTLYMCVNKFEPFKQIFLYIYMGSSVLISSVPFTSPLELRLLDDKREFAPLSFVNMSFIENELKAAYKLTTEATFK